MSLNVNVQCFEHGEPAGLPRPSIRALFPVGADSEPDYWRVRYDDRNSCDVIVVPHSSGGELVQWLCVHRPCADGRPWDAILEVMRLGPVAVYVLGATPPLIADDAVARELGRSAFRVNLPLPTNWKSGRPPVPVVIPFRSPVSDGSVTVSGYQWATDSTACEKETCA